MDTHTQTHTYLCAVSTQEAEPYAVVALTNVAKPKKRFCFLWVARRAESEEDRTVHTSPQTPTPSRNSFSSPLHHPPPPTIHMLCIQTLKMQSFQRNCVLVQLKLSGSACRSIKGVAAHQSGSQVVPILLTVYLFHPSTGGKVQMKEKVHTKSRPITACLDCSLMFPRGRQITKNLSKERTARDHSATIPGTKTTSPFRNVTPRLATAM